MRRRREHSRMRRAIAAPCRPLQRAEIGPPPPPGWGRPLPAPPPSPRPSARPQGSRARGPPPTQVLRPALEHQARAAYLPWPLPPPRRLCPLYKQHQGVGPQGERAPLCSRPPPPPRCCGRQAGRGRRALSGPPQPPARPSHHLPCQLPTAPAAPPRLSVPYPPSSGTCPYRHSHSPQRCRPHQALSLSRLGQGGQLSRPWVRPVRQPIEYRQWGELQQGDLQQRPRRRRQPSGQVLSSLSGEEVLPSPSAPEAAADPRLPPTPSSSQLPPAPHIPPDPPRCPLQCVCLPPCSPPKAAPPAPSPPTAASCPRVRCRWHSLRPARAPSLLRFSPTSLRPPVQRWRPSWPWFPRGPRQGPRPVRERQRVQGAGPPSRPQATCSTR